MVALALFAVIFQLHDCWRNWINHSEVYKVFFVENVLVNLFLSADLCVCVCARARARVCVRRGVGQVELTTGRVFLLWSVPDVHSFHR